MFKAIKEFFFPPEVPVVIKPLKPKNILHKDAQGYYTRDFEGRIHRLSDEEAKSILPL